MLPEDHGRPCTDFLLSKTHMGPHKRSGHNTGVGDYTWIDLYKIVDVHAVIGGRHVPEAARANGGGSGAGRHAGGGPARRSRCIDMQSS